MNRLFIFNPGHDLALGNGDPNFVLPASAEKFADQCAGIMLLLADRDDYILAKDDKYIRNLASQLYLGSGDHLPEVLRPEDIHSHSIGQIVPWGWDIQLKRNLQKLKIEEKLLPTDETLGKIRDLSHRRTALQALSYLKEDLSRKLPSPVFHLLIPELPEELKSTEEAQNYLDRQNNIVFKAPWSGSGKGLRWCREKFSHSDSGWIRNTIASQGSIMGEIRREIVLNFAMEFYCASAIPTFCAYSLFGTRNGAYEGNLLASDEEIEKRICQYIPSELLSACRDSLSDFLRSEIAANYEGYIGIDMFIYREEGSEREAPHYFLNPVVEINFRLTMGLIFHRLYTLLKAQEKLSEDHKDHYVSISFSEGAYRILLK